MNSDNQPTGNPGRFSGRGVVRLWGTGVLLLLGLVPVRGERAEDPLLWPEGGVLPVAYETVEEAADGVVMERLALTGRDLDLRMRLPRGWVIVREPPDRFSFAIRHRIRPEMVLGLAQFPPGRFLSDLSEESWSAYKKGLADAWGEGLEILEEPHRMEIGRGTVILGESNRAILYRIPRDGGDELRLEFFLFHRGRLLAFSLRGPENLVRANRSTIQFHLGRMAVRVDD